MKTNWVHHLQPLWSLFLKGLAAVLPLAITLYLVFWIGGAAESIFGNIVRTLFPEWVYFPGLGIVCAIGFVLGIGLVIQQWFVSRLVSLGEEMLKRIPLVNTVYSGIRDIMDFISQSNRRSDLQRVVLVEIKPGWQVIGFVTDESAGSSLPELYRGSTEFDGDADLVAVYVPLSYQIGGLTLWLPRADLQTLDLSVEDAMRVVLTAGVNRPKRGANTRPDGPAPAGGSPE